MYLKTYFPLSSLRAPFSSCASPATLLEVSTYLNSWVIRSSRKISRVSLNVNRYKHEQHTPAEDRQKEKSTIIITRMPMVISLEFKLHILIDDIFQSRKHKTLMRSLRVQRSKLVVGPWHPDISMRKCFHRGQVVKSFFSRETSFISWLLCLFFHASQRISYLTSASFKNFIRCDSCSHVPFRFTFQVS